MQGIDTGLIGLDAEARGRILSKCFVPYSPTSPPTLHGVPIHLDQDASGSVLRGHSISLSHALLEDARAQLETAFSSAPGSFLVDKQDDNTRVLPVTVICSPRVDCLEAVDASVRYLASVIKADIVIVDPDDFAAGRDGVYGQDITSAISSLYTRHYSAPRADSASSTTTSSRASSPDSVALPPPETEHGLGNSQREESLSPWTTSYLDALVHMALPDAEPANRRLLYLRDFSALSKALSPLLDALKSAASLGPSRVLVIVGFCPVQRVAITADGKSRAESRARRVLEKMSNVSDFIGYLNVRHNAVWRRAKTPTERFASLEHTFTSLFVNRYQGGYLGSRSSGDQRLLDAIVTDLSFVRVLRVALSEDLPPPVLEIGRGALQRRFINANFHLLGLRVSRDDAREVLPHVRTSNDMRALAKKFDANVWAELTTHVYDASELQDIAASWDLSPAATIAEIFSVRRRRAVVENAWAQCIKSAGRAGGSDMIVEQVKQDSNLGKKEKSLLSCIVDPTTITTTFDDVCIQPSIIEALRTAVSLPLLAPEAFSTGILASESSSGVLLYGPPGTGKTLACRALAKESGVRMLQIQASNVQDMYVGESEKIVHAIFELARRLGPCIVFIDELDSLFSSRGDTPIWHTSQLTEFMQEMDGLRTADLNRQKGVIVIGATNRPQDLDSAVVRRLPRRILVGLPGIHERKNIIAQYLRGEVVDESVKIDSLAASTGLYSGSDLKHLVLSAALAALKESRLIVWERDELGGFTRAIRRSGAPQRRITAAHFKVALKEITASCLADMKGLDALNQWRGGSAPITQSSAPRQAVRQQPVE